MYKVIYQPISPEGWISEYLRREADGITGNLHRICKEVCSGIYSHNRTQNSGKSDGSWGSWWPGESQSNWEEALVRLAHITGDSALQKQADAIVQAYLDSQDEDGYIGIYQPGHRFSCGERSGELWTQSRVMNILLQVVRTSGRTDVLAALRRMADCTIQHYGPLAGGRSFYTETDIDGGKAHGLMIVEPLLGLYHQTGTASYLDFCEFLYNDYSEHIHGFPCEDIARHNLSDPTRPLISHGPHTCEQLRVPLLLYNATRKPEYLSLFRAGMDKVKHSLCLSGSCKSDEMIGAYVATVLPNGSEKGGFDGCVVLPSNGYEYCATVELMLTLQAAFEILGDTEYAEMAEWLVMNAGMAARRHDGKAIQYLCADNCYEATRERGDRWDYSPTHMDAAVCCAPNACRMMPAYLERMWLQTDEGLLAQYYGPCTLKTEVGGGVVRIAQETLYPFEDTVRFTVHGAGRFALRLRIPTWCNGPIITVNSEIDRTSGAAPGGIASLTREWRDGDTVTLQLPAEVRVLRANDGSAALAHGPLLYAHNIAANGTVTHDYGLEGFCDTDYLPASGEQWDYTLCLDPAWPSRSGNLVADNAGSGYPWDTPPVALAVTALDSWSIQRDLRLIPIGCTLLRRTAFPAVVRASRGERER